MLQHADMNEKFFSEGLANWVFVNTSHFFAPVKYSKQKMIEQ